MLTSFGTGTKEVPDQQGYGGAGNSAGWQTQQSKGDSSQRLGHTILKWATTYRGQNWNFQGFPPRPLPLPRVLVSKQSVLCFCFYAQF